MKKLMIAFVAVAIASVANAAACNWTGSAVALSTSANAGSATSYTVYLMDPAVVAIADMSSAFADGTYASKLADAVQTTSGIAVGTTSARWGKSGWGDFTSGETYTYYSVVLNNNISSADQYMITGTVTKQTPSTGQLQMSFGSQAANTWADIAPEPTSGLLMLLGMGALALRRRRA